VPAGLARLHAGVAGRTVVELAGSAD
jgi:hypothetical protein